GRVDRHGGVPALLADDGAGGDRAERVEGAGAEPGKGGEDQEYLEARGEADRREEYRGPGEGEGGEARAVPVGEPAEEGLGHGRGTRIGEGDKADGLQVELEPVCQDRVEDREETGVHVHREVARCQSHEGAIPEDRPNGA